jgi:hypothetical protein
MGMKSFYTAIFLAAWMVLSVRAGQTNELLGGAKPKASSQTDHATDDKAIDVVMEKLERTFKAGDYNYTFEIMYTPVLDKMGGKEKGLEVAKSVAAQMKEQKIVMISWKAKKPYQYVTGKKHDYALVPYEAVLTMEDKKLRQTSFELAVKVGDSKWQFVNGDNINSSVLDEFFPDFPKKVELPKVERAYE